MSYVRWSEDSDLYIYPDVAGGATCCGCTLPEAIYSLSDDEVQYFNEPFGVNLPSIMMMIAHVGQHRRIGDTVPDGLEDKMVRIEMEDKFVPLSDLN